MDFKDFKAKMEQDADHLAELQRLIELKEIEIKMMKDKYAQQVETNVHFQNLKSQVAKDQGNLKYLLEIIADKTSNFERRHCEQSYEMAGAARNLQVFVQATGRGTLSREHLKVFADWILAGECPEDFNYGQINMMKDQSRVQNMASILWFKYNEDSLID